MSTPTSWIWPLTCVVLGLSIIRGETTPPEERPAEPKALLLFWKEANRSARAFHYTFKQTNEDKVFATKEVVEGEVTGQSPDLWRIDHNKAGKKLHTYLVTKRSVRCFDYERKVEAVVEAATECRYLSEQASFSDLFNGRLLVWDVHHCYWFYLDTSLDDLEKLFELKASSPDKYWAYLEVNPKRLNGDFRRMQIVLDRKKLWVRRIWTEQFNGSTVCMDLDQPTALAKSPSPESLSKDLPSNWKKVKLNHPISLEAE